VATGSPTPTLEIGSSLHGIRYHPTRRAGGEAGTKRTGRLELVRTLLRSFVIPLSLLAITACVHDPTVTLNHAELNGVQMAAFPPRIGILLTVVVDITNPNRFDVAVRGMRGQVVLAEKYPLPINYVPAPPGQWLRAGQSTSVRLPIDMPIELAVALLREAFGAPVIGFHVTGVVDVTGSSTFKVDKDNFPVDLRGTMTRQQVEGVVPAFLMPR
jgi:hypothetical protein